MWEGCENTLQLDSSLVDINKEKHDKERFAVAWIQNPNDVLSAARAIEPYDSYRASWIAAEWISDPYVLAHRAKMLTDTAQLLPTRVQLTHLAFDIATDKHAAHETKLKALRFCSDIQGWTGPAVNNVIMNNTVSTTNRVMEVPMEVSLDNWEKMAMKQQEALTTSYAYVDE